MKNPNTVRNYYVLPCCLLLLNLCVEIVSYKVKMFDDALLRTAAIMAMVLFGGSFVDLVMAPAISVLVSTMHRGEPARGGGNRRDFIPPPPRRGGVLALLPHLQYRPTVRAAGGLAQPASLRRSD